MTWSSRPKLVVKAIVPRTSSRKRVRRLVTSSPASARSRFAARSAISSKLRGCGDPVSPSAARRTMSSGRVSKATCSTESLVCRRRFFYLKRLFHYYIEIHSRQRQKYRNAFPTDGFGHCEGPGARRQGNCIWHGASSPSPLVGEGR